jgi:ribosomal protein S27E
MTTFTTPNVTNHTRAGSNGKRIQCPHCGRETTVCHFSWSAMKCQGCGEFPEKLEWLVRPDQGPMTLDATIDPATFTRLKEIDAYAQRAECDRAQAMRELVNMALSLLCWECKLDIGGEDVGESDPYGGMCAGCRRKAINADVAWAFRFVAATENMVDE